MATTVTLTFSDPDVPRCTSAATSPNQIVAGAALPNFPPSGATNAALLKAWLVGLAQQATLIHEGSLGGLGVGSGTPPTIT